MHHVKIVIVISLLMMLTIFFSRCLNNDSLATHDPRGDQYAGMKTCIKCHRDIFNSYSHSNHYKTSSEINSHVLEKLITASNNYFYFPDSTRILIEKKVDSFYQSYFAKDKKVVSHKYNIAFGSAEKAQTFAGWNGDKLLQLPLTYFSSMNVWANSPGFPSSHPRFDRVIVSRCFECHASWINKQFVQTGPVAVSEKLDRTSIIYGIDCERCHGPALNHVQFYQQNPSAKKSMFMVSMHSLNRQQSLDVCATCHSGNDRSTQKSLFAFMPGDTLSNFYYPDFGSNTTEPDVHGKQLQLLQSSLCFQKSDMTCITCHNSHETTESKAEGFISKCMNCHQSSAHALKEMEQTKKNPDLLSKNCIDCHMPLQPSKTIYFNSGAGLKNIPYFLRTHKIAVYR